MDAWMGIIAVLVGLVTCFYGYPLFRGLLVLAGLLIGYALGQAFVQVGHPWLSLFLGAVGAVGLGVLAYPLWSVGVTVSGAVLGFVILSAIGVAANASQGVSLLMGVIGAALAGVLFYQARDFLVMLTTALNGAVEVAVGLGWLAPALALRPGVAGWPALIIIVALGACGLAVQFRMFKERRLYTSPPAAEAR